VLCVCVRTVCSNVCVCVCVCVCAWRSKCLYCGFNVFIIDFLGVYVCLGMCVCWCVRSCGTQKKARAPETNVAAWLP